MATRSAGIGVSNPFAIPSTQMTGLRNYMPAPYNPTAGLADIIRMQAAMARASGGGGGGGGGAGGYNPRYTRMVKVPKGDGTFIDVPVTGPTQKERDAEATRMIKEQQDAILANDKPLQDTLSKLSSLSAQGQKEEIDKIRKEMLPRLTQATGLSAEQLSTRILEKPLAEQKAREKLVNEGYVGRSLLDGAKMAFGSLAAAVRSIGATPEEKLAIGNARREENQKSMEANPYLDEQRRLSQEGRSSMGYTWDNKATAAASSLARMAPVMAPVMVATAVGGPLGAALAIGGGALGGAGMAAGETLERVASDPNLTPAQKLSVIDAAQTKAAAVSGVLGAIPVGPLGVTRIARQGLRAIGPGIGRSMAENTLDNAVLGGAYQLGTNLAYNSGTGQSLPVFEGTLESALAGAALGVPFGIHAGRVNNRMRAQRAAAEENARLNAPVETPLPQMDNYTVDPNFGLQMDTLRRAQGDAAWQQMQARQAAAAYEQANNAMARDWLGGNLGAYAPLPPQAPPMPAHAVPTTTTITPQYPLLRPIETPLAAPEVTNPYRVPLFGPTQTAGNIPGLPRVLPERTGSVRSSRTLEERGGVPLFFDNKSFETSIRKSNSSNAEQRSYNLTLQALENGATPDDISRSVARFSSSNQALDKTRVTGMERALNEYRARQTTSGGDQQPANLGTNGQQRAAGVDDANLPANRPVPTDTPATPEPAANAHVEQAAPGNPTAQERGAIGSEAPGARAVETPPRAVGEQGIGGTQGANGERSAGAAAPENAAGSSRTGEPGPARNASACDDANAAATSGSGPVAFSEATQRMLNDFPPADRLRAQVQYLRARELADDALKAANGDVVTAYSNLLRDKSLGLDQNYSRAITHALVEKFNETPPVNAREKASQQAANILHDSNTPAEPLSAPPTLRDIMEQPEVWQQIAGRKYAKDAKAGREYLANLIDRYQRSEKLTPSQRKVINKLREQGMEIAEPLDKAGQERAATLERERGFTPENDARAEDVRVRDAVRKNIDDPNGAVC